MTSEVRDDRARFDARLIVPGWLILSLMLTVAGPFGTYGTIDLPQRALVWLLLVAFGFCVALALVLVSNRYGSRFGRYFVGIVTATGTSLVFAPVFVAVMRRMAATGHGPERVPGLAEVALFIFSATGGICALRAIWVPKHIAAPAPAVSEESSPAPYLIVAPRLIDRLSPELRGELLRISVRDHYVDVTTSTGTQALLMRFSDAIAETDEASGLRVHRSHWVAEKAVASVSELRGKVVLHLIDGSEVPVSRPHMAALAERGLLQPRDSGSTRAGVPVVTASAPGLKSRVKDGASV